MNKKKDWELAWLDDQTYYWTSLVDWSEFAGEAAKELKEDNARVGETNEERCDRAAEAPRAKSREE